MIYNKIWIESLILIFMFTTCSLCVLFSLYYITPSNYKLCKICDSDKLFFKKEYVIEPNKKKKIKTLKYSDNCFLHSRKILLGLSTASLSSANEMEVTSSSLYFISSKPTGDFQVVFMKRIFAG